MWMSLSTSSSSPSPDPEPSSSASASPFLVGVEERIKEAALVITRPIFLLHFLIVFLVSFLGEKAVCASLVVILVIAPPGNVADNVPDGGKQVGEHVEQLHH